MKRITYASVFAVALLFMFTTCKKDPCKDVICLNAGTCVLGICDCLTGYEGDDCGTESRSKILGTYEVTDDCSLSGTTIFNVIVTKSGTSVTDILISNFYNQFQQSVVATVDGNVITIADQDPDGNSFTVGGSGTYDSSTSSITFSYSIEDEINQNNDVCTSVWVKQ